MTSVVGCSSAGNGLENAILDRESGRVRSTIFCCPNSSARPKVKNMFRFCFQRR
jgi:hypothetical protein